MKAINKTTSQELDCLTYTVKDVSQLLGLSKVSVHKLIKEGKLEALTIFHKFFIERESLDRFMRENFRVRK